MATWKEPIAELRFTSKTGGRIERIELLLEWRNGRKLAPEKRHMEPDQRSALEVSSLKGKMIRVNYHIIGCRK